ncbi:hypothetical protein LCGC14_0756680 [marine sediment metagenome]|uniref:Uncharacterized protein n=1 Tax=marine sediment metagenome TaxID=412755 RepID=A0A0F9QM81_9ZZZZ|nr:hypothetical protein [Pricia sp.]
MKTQGTWIFWFLLVAIVFIGCTDTQQVPDNIKPLDQHLLPIPQDWKDAYGDTLETQLVYNKVVGANDDKILQKAILMTAETLKQTNNRIVDTIEAMHAADPNEVIWRESVEKRLDALEYVPEQKICELTYDECFICREVFFIENPHGLWFGYSGIYPEPTNECDDYRYITADVLCDKHESAASPDIDFGETASEFLTDSFME